MIGMSYGKSSVSLGIDFYYVASMMLTISLRYQQPLGLEAQALRFAQIYGLDCGN